MTVVHAVVQAAATVAPSLSPSPSVSPSVAPVVHAAAVHVAAHADLVTSLTNYVNSHQGLLALVGGAVLFFLQNLLNKLPWLKGEADVISQGIQDIKREVIALGLPALVVGLWALVQGSIPANWVAEVLSLYAAAKAVFNGVKLAKLAVNKAALSLGQVNPQTQPTQEGQG